MRMITGWLALLALVQIVAGCALPAGGGDAALPNEPGYSHAADWECVYQPTFNHDWHDDVLCSNGTDQLRPHLRAWDDFVTKDEIMESAREFERNLNAG